MTVPAVDRAEFTYDELDAVADSSASTVLALWLLRAEMGEADWRATVSGALSLLVQQAEALGRLFGRRAIPTSNVGLPVDGKPREPAPEEFVQTGALLGPPERDPDVALRDAQTTARLGKAVDTLADVIERPESPQKAAEQDLDRVERLARDEPVEAAQRGYLDGLRIESLENPEGERVTGYRRGLNPDACQLCFWLWKEGYVYPVDMPMHRHTGCRCLPLPTTDRLGRTTLSTEDRALLDSLHEAHTKKKGKP